MDISADLIPVTLLTGFLGSGKTTVLNHLVRQPGLADALVIINEFGEMPLDHMLMAHSTENLVMEMSSGCLCCTIRNDLVQANVRESLMHRLDGINPAAPRWEVINGEIEAATVLNLGLFSVDRKSPDVGRWLREEGYANDAAHAHDHSAQGGHAHGSEHGDQGAHAEHDAREHHDHDHDRHDVNRHDDHIRALSHALPKAWEAAG